MAEIKIAAIMRAGAYSPNHIGNDAAILNAAAEQLRKRGCLVNIYSEEQFNNQGVEENVILNMCREQKSIENLQKAEDAGKIVINSGFGIENCTRERMTRILLGNGIPYPESLIVNTDEAIKPMLKKSGFQSCWIKRGDFHAMHKEDVSFVRHPEEAQEVLQEYFLRGIKRAVINVHLEGDLVKFYGVVGTPFFYSFYPTATDYSKFGLERHNGEPHHYAYNAEALQQAANVAARALGLTIYGGDAIVSPDGHFYIIDFNDWPSFAACRKVAAKAIAERIESAFPVVR